MSMWRSPSAPSATRPRRARPRRMRRARSSSAFPPRRARQARQLEQSKSRSLTVRTFVDGAKATLSTTELSADGLRALVLRAVEAAKSVAATR